MVARWLATAALWVRIQTPLKNTKWAIKAKEWPPKKCNKKGAAWTNVKCAGLLYCSRPGFESRPGGKVQKKAAQLLFTSAAVNQSRCLVQPAQISKEEQCTNIVNLKL